LSLMAATMRNTLSTNHAPIITSSVRMDRVENNGLTQAAATTVSRSNEAWSSAGYLPRQCVSCRGLTFR
jgi:hypothetical protein